MSDQKNQPTYFLKFREKQPDGHGRFELGSAIDVGIAWPRDNKKSDIVRLHLSSEKLGDGIWFLSKNEKHPLHAQGENQAPQAHDKNQPTHYLLFCEKQRDTHGRNKLGAAIQAASVWPSHEKEGSTLDWNLSPKKLDNGVWFLKSNERQKNQNKTQEKDAFDQVNTNNKEQGLSR